MKKLINILFLCVVFVNVHGQTAPQKNKKNTEKTKTFLPKKIVIIGLTDNIEARRTFETKMKEKLTAYDIDAYESIEVSTMLFTEINKAEQELNELIGIIAKIDFDSFMITAVTRVDEKEDTTGGRLGNYKIYHLETDIYTFEEEKISLLWGLCLDIYDYQLVQLKIEDYVDAIVLQMQNERIVPKSDEPKQLQVTN